MVLLTVFTRTTYAVSVLKRYRVRRSVGRSSVCPRGSARQQQSAPQQQNRAAASNEHRQLHMTHGRVNSGPILRRSTILVFGATGGSNSVIRGATGYGVCLTTGEYLYLPAAS